MYVARACERASPHARARFLWKSDRRGSTLSPDRSLKWHSQARIASLEQPNHVSEYIIRLLSAVQLRENVRPMQRDPPLVNTRGRGRRGRATKSREIRRNPPRIFTKRERVKAKRTQPPATTVRFNPRCTIPWRSRTDFIH